MTQNCDGCGEEFLRTDLTWCSNMAGSFEFLFCSSCLEGWHDNPEPDRIRQLIRERHGIKEEH
jgi:predicted amidophosphoribosyltransferase